MLICACEEMSSVREPNLTAQLNPNLLKLLQTTLENIHHADFVCEANNDVEAGRMES